MNLQQFEHFLALAETGSFSRAAERLHITQPALSKSIQALEEAVGAALIDRKGRRKEVTPVGALVVERVRRIRLEVSELKRSAALLAAMEVGTVRLGLGPTPTVVLAARLLQHVLRDYPRIKLQLSGGSAEVQLQSLRGRQLDALVIHKRRIPAWPDLDVQLAAPMRLGFVCRSGHPLAEEGRMTFARLSRYPVAASGVVSAEILQRLNAHFGRRAHFESVVHYESDDLTCLLEMVRASDVVFFGVVEAARAGIERGTLVEVRAYPSLGLTSEFAFITLEGAADTPSLRVVRQFCMEAMRSDA